MALVDLICLALLLLVLWYPFEWVAKRIILRIIRLNRKMNADVVEISDEYHKDDKCSACHKKRSDKCKCGEEPTK
jgi:hypothetical protein